MKKDKSWNVFVIAIGLILIVIAPSTEAMFPQIVAGIAITGLGFYLLKKK